MDRLISVEKVENKIFQFRGRRVMLDKPCIALWRKTNSIKATSEKEQGKISRRFYVSAYG